MNYAEIIHRLKTENAILVGQANKLGLTFKRYPEQGDAQKLLAGELPYLTFNKEFSTVKEDRTERDTPHVLIEGDNLSALVALQSTHKGKVDVIYIDPPYNTGNNDFVYNDSYVSNDDGFRHSKWLSFMEPRLELARDLLSETGAIFVSIDDNEQAALKMLMDRVFGASNFVDTIIWEKTYSTRNDAKHFSRSHDFILVYRKSDKWTRSLLPRTEKANAHYKYDDNNGRGKYRTGDISVARNTPKSIYGVINTKSGREFFPPKGRAWSVSSTKMQELIDDDRIYWGKDGLGGPQIKRYLVEVQEGIVPQTIWKYEVVGHTDEGAKEVKTIIGGGLFDYPKPVRLIQQIIKLHPHKHALILDFFAGSGTTGHAIAALNAEDGGNRQAILVTNNFEQDGSPNGIARDVTAARMKAVLTGQWADGKEHQVLPGELHYYQLDFVSKTEVDTVNLTGVINMGENAYTPVKTEVKHPALQVFNVYNEDKWVAVWNDSSVFDLGDEKVEEAIVSLNREATESNKALTWYVAVRDSSISPYIPDVDLFTEENSEAEVIPYPFSYIKGSYASVVRLKNTGKLVEINLDEIFEESEFSFAENDSTL